MGFSLGSRSLIFTLPTVTGAADGNTQYKNLVTNTASANLIGFWPMDEITGTTSDNAEGTAARDGAFSNVTLNAALNPFGGAAGSWNGTTSYNNIYTASLASAFNGAEGTLMAWAKVSGSAVWTDGSADGIVYLLADANNKVYIRKNTVNNQIQVLYTAGGTNEDIRIATSSTVWNMYAVTWSASGDAVKAYFNGAQSGSTQATLGTFAGSLASTTTVIGATSTSPAGSWSGNLAYVAVWDTPLTADQISTLYNGGPT